ncbi:hypothetical protein CDL15_Pgr017098 [Punica granatum]|uniref:Stress up-regulated Nod 19 protein n=1 Tax=Punica granatum TaxID=22663 RepID=A0A218W006_PUNGR|nr:hypothetical protein CDL15_Pgr017098 [Punica granatum]
MEALMALPIWFLLSVSLLVDLSSGRAVIEEGNDNGMKSATFLSPVFELGPGSVENKYYFDVDFPRGHIAIKNFNAEVVDDQGNPVPLHETYLHHWVMSRYYQRDDENGTAQSKEHVFARNSGICQGNALGQYFGLGSETRRTATHVPDPYGIEVGNPPAGFQEKWMLNVHAIDTRGAEDRLGCTECRCDLYNVTLDEYGRPLRPDYKGGLHCCYDHTQCRTAQGFHGTRRKLFLRYTVVWLDWNISSIIPVRIYIFDVTDTWKRPVNDSTEPLAAHECRVEYEIKACSSNIEAHGSCIETKKTSLSLPDGGYVIYGVAHQHSGGLGSNLYGQDGRLICSSVPTYGKGKEAGNETGYIVGMSTCYPQPGSVKIADGETLVLESNYSSSQGHTGVMGLFYILVADHLPSSLPYSQSPVQVQSQ